MTAGRAWTPKQCRESCDSPCEIQGFPYATIIFQKHYIFFLRVPTYRLSYSYKNKITSRKQLYRPGKSLARRRLTKYPTALMMPTPPYSIRIQGGSVLIKKTTNSLLFDFPHINHPRQTPTSTATEKIPTIEELDYWLSPLSTEQQAVEFLRRKNLLADGQDTE